MRSRTPLQVYRDEADFPDIACSICGERSRPTVYRIQWPAIGYGGRRILRPVSVCAEHLRQVQEQAEAKMNACWEIQQCIKGGHVPYLHPSQVRKLNDLSNQEFELPEDYAPSPVPEFWDFFK